MDYDITECTVGRASETTLLFNPLYDQVEKTARGKHATYGIIDKTSDGTPRRVRKVEKTKNKHFIEDEKKMM